MNGDAVLATGREFIAGFAREAGDLALAADEIEAISELLARGVLSFLVTPSSVLGMRTPAEIRRFAEHYLAPTLRALEAR